MLYRVVIGCSVRVKPHIAILWVLPVKVRQGAQIRKGSMENEQPDLVPETTQATVGSLGSLTEHVINNDLMMASNGHK